MLPHTPPPRPRRLTARPQKPVQAGHGVQAYLKGEVGCQEDEAEAQQCSEKAARVTCGGAGRGRPAHSLIICILGAQTLSEPHLMGEKPGWGSGPGAPRQQGQLQVSALGALSCGTWQPKWGSPLLPGKHASGCRAGAAGHSRRTRGDPGGLCSRVGARTRQASVLIPVLSELAVQAAGRSRVGSFLPQPPPCRLGVPEDLDSSTGPTDFPALRAGRAAPHWPGRRKLRARLFTASWHHRL